MQHQGVSMRVRVTKVRDLSRNTQDFPPERGKEPLPDKTGPITDHRRSVIGVLRRFTGWYARYALHETALSFTHAFEGKDARLIVYGATQIITGPIVRYRIDGMDSEGYNGDYAEMRVKMERRAEVETINSIYEVVLLREGEG